MDTDAHSRRPDSLTGLVGSQDYFTFTEGDRIDPARIRGVLEGEVAGTMFRNVVPEETRQAVASRFWSCPARRSRGDDVPGFYVGAFHYGKTTEEYLKEAEGTTDHVKWVLGARMDVLAPLDDALRSLANFGFSYRAAQQGGHFASKASIRSWHGDHRFALAPHEDISQCQDPRQADFEIQRAANNIIAAFNICIENGPGGSLLYWNIRPDRQSRRELGVTYTGIPYPIDLLDGFESKVIDIRPGDIYIFNSTHVHAVEPSHDPTERRTTVSGLLGKIDDTTVVQWT